MTTTRPRPALGQLLRYTGVGGASTAASLVLDAALLRFTTHRLLTLGAMSTFRPKSAT